jgi:hypothetical protein
MIQFLPFYGIEATYKEYRQENGEQGKACKYKKAF